MRKGGKVNVIDEYAIYLRKSRSDIELEKYNNNLDTLSRHERILKNLCAVEGYNVTKIYREVVSGETISERKEMQHLLADITANRYKGVLIVEVSRLSRGDKIDQGRITKIFKYTNTLVITPEKVYDLSNEKDEEAFEDELTNSGKELKTIKKRLNRGRRSSVLEGKYVGNVPPYGYKRIKIENDKGFTLQELPEEAIIVRKIFNMYVYDNLNKNQISSELDRLEIKPRKADKWSPSTIKDMLRNPVYIGKIRWDHRKAVKYLKTSNILEEEIAVSRPRNLKPLIVDGMHKGIISNEVWELAQAKLSKNTAPVQHNNIIQNPLAHILICGKCGSYMQRRPYRKRGETTAIQCNNTECNNISSKLHIVEDKVIKGLKYWLKDYKLSDDRLKQEKKVDNINYYRNIIKQLNDNITTQKNRLSKVCEAYEDGIYDSEVYQSRCVEINEAINQIEHQIIEYQEQVENEKKLLTEKEVVIPKIENVLDIYDKLETPEEKNRLLKTVIEKVTYIKETKTLKKTDDPTDFEIHIYPKLPR